MERKIKLKSLNAHITCKICSGYLIDATTVIECLHTFCKSCLVKHLEEKNTCPECEQVIHQSHPLQYISFDRTMQDIVYKLVPSLQDSKNHRLHKKLKLLFEFQFLFLWLILMLNNPIVEINSRKEIKIVQQLFFCFEYPEIELYRYLEKKEEVTVLIFNLFQVSMCLECLDTDPETSLGQLKRKFIRCSAQATVTHLKKFIAYKLLNDIDKYKDVDIICNDEPLGKDHTLKFVYVTKWRFKEPPLMLQYRPKIDFI
ncbi:LOW QUALITY PROTEIN: polycomb group RING finger protein 3-like [Artemia franciscana]|uniref:LOW QUALITY PROTEIN: polycomb group RING finger protein 3-like n=1 Tax=Artemia franciscana TaxID=6661 RepID=UPI0032DA2310